MAEFDPEAKLNHIYTDGSVKIKVIGFDGEGNQRAVYKNVDENDNEIEPQKTINKSQWNRRNFRDLTSNNGGGNGGNGNIPPNGSLYTIEVSSEGELIIRNKEGIEVVAANIKGPEGSHGLIGPQGPTGEKGEDGVTWAPRITEDGKSLYFENERGDRTTTYSFRGQDGERGAQGATGPKGQDADLWKPVITDDGRYLFFENQRGEHTEKFLIQGIKGDTGGEGPRGPEGPSGPVFIPSVNADGELSWSNTGNLPNPTPINIKGSQGNKGENGAIFHPVIVDGYLTWTNDKGLPNPEPVKITGPQGVAGDTGQRGKSAYDLWLEAGNLGTKEEFLASLKGEKGEAAEVITTSYEDVTDYKCKVQEIDTNLIVDSDEPTQSPEEIIEERIQEIKELREKGHTQEMQDLNRVGFFKRFMWRCAGADRDLLTMCPGDHSKYVGIGSVILFTALMAWFSSTIAMRLVLKSPIDNYVNWQTAGAILFGFGWASMIFFLDRFITNTMYSDGKVTISKEEFFSGLPRITIAIFLGIVISAPLELMIFDQEIDTKINELSQFELRKHSLDDKQRLQNLENELQGLLNSQRKIESNIENKNSIEQAIKEEKQLNDRNLKQISADYPYPRKPGGDRSTNESGWKNYDEQCNETNKQRREARETENERHRDALASIPKFSNSDDLGKEGISSQIEIKRNEISTLRNTITADLKTAQQKFEKNKNGLGMKLRALHAIAMEGYTPWFYKEMPSDSVLHKGLDAISSQLDKDSTNLKAANGKNEYVYGAENHKFAAAMDTILHAWWWYLFNSAQGLIMLLFILIDVSPVLYKMMLADGNYDNYLHQEKLLAQDKIRLSLSNMLKKLNDSELKRVAPFIMGDIYEKMAGDSYIYKTEEEFRAEIAEQKNTFWLWRIWPLSMIRWIFWKEEDKPSAPVIIMEPKDNTYQQNQIAQVNEAVFDEVLDMKRRIILASYRRWYKRQHDNILGDRVDDDNVGRAPFDEGNLGEE